MYLPLHFKVDGKKLLFVGGGRVNERRILQVLNTGARIVVVSPTLTSTLKELFLENRIEWVKRTFSFEDLEDAFLVFVAVPSGYSEIVEAAKSRGIPVECASRGELGDFIFPAVIKEGDVLVSVSSGGKDPALTTRLKRLIRDVLKG